MLLAICLVGGLIIPSIVVGQGIANISRTQSVFSSEFKFNQSRAYELIEKQVALGPRYPGSEGIEKTRLFIENELSVQQKWNVFYQNFTEEWTKGQNITIVNVMCQPKDFNESEEAFILLAHYDTRLWADKDPDPQKRTLPVPGANDGASGVAIGLELGRILVEYNLTNFLLLFVDAEDQGNINGWNWLLGSKFFVESPVFQRYNFSFGILLDMVGAKGATFFREGRSYTYAKDLVTTVWNTADTLGYSNFFIKKTGPWIQDDHVPFITKGIPVIDIIDDFLDRYDSHHTTTDDLSQISPVTLGAVGQTLEAVLVQISNGTTLLSGLTKFTFRSPFLTIGSGILSGLALLVILLGPRREKNSKVQ